MGGPIGSLTGPKVLQVTQYTGITILYLCSRLNKTQKKSHLKGGFYNIVQKEAII